MNRSTRLPLSFPQQAAQAGAGGALTPVTAFPTPSPAPAPHATVGDSRIHALYRSWREEDDSASDEAPQVPVPASGGDPLRELYRSWVTDDSPEQAAGVPRPSGPTTGAATLGHPVGHGPVPSVYAMQLEDRLSGPLTASRKRPLHDAATSQGASSRPRTALPEEALPTAPRLTQTQIAAIKNQLDGRRIVGWAIDMQEGLIDAGFSTDQILNIATGGGGALALKTFVRRFSALQQAGFSPDQLTRLASHPGSTRTLNHVFDYVDTLRQRGLSLEQVTRLSARRYAAKNVELAATLEWVGLIEPEELVTMLARHNGDFNLRRHLEGLVR